MNNRELLNKILNLFTEGNVKLRRDRKTEALDSWRSIVDEIVSYAVGDERFSRLGIFHTGSYYERAKVGEPDEFDLMLIMGNLELVLAGVKYIHGLSQWLSVQPTGFITVLITDRDQVMLWQQDQCVNDLGMLNATKVKAVFARLVRDVISARRYESNVTVKSQGPAVTLKIINRNGREYSVDLTIAIKCRFWPRVAEEWRTRHRNGWPNQSLVNKICQDGCHLVAKQPKGHDVPEHEKGCFWRFSFSAAEKNLFLHGGQGEASSCQKQVLRILKALRDELHLEPLKSYHLKTMLFYECEANPHPSQWSSTCLSDRFLGLLRRLENCLLQLNCPHYFIHNLNLFEMLNPQKCSELAKLVRGIRLQPGQVLINLIPQA